MLLRAEALEPECSSLGPGPDTFGCMILVKSLLLCLNFFMCKMGKMMVATLLSAGDI